MLYAVVHAEANAILHKTCIDLKGCTLYVTLFPCNECAKLIIQSGIEKVYFLEGEPTIPEIESSEKGNSSDEKKEKKYERPYTLAARRLFEMTGYTLLPFNSDPHGRTRLVHKFFPCKL